MKRCCLSLLILFSNFAFAASWDNPSSLPTGVVHGTFNSVAVGAPVGFNIYLPDEYSSTTNTYPVIYHMHGQGGTEGHETYLATTLRTNINNGQLAPMIMVFANGYDDSFYGNSAPGAPSYRPVEHTIIAELINHVEQNYRVKPGRNFRAMQGFSMGGQGANLYGHKFPGLFCTLVNFASGCRDWDSMVANKNSTVVNIYGNKRECYEPHSSWNWVNVNQNAIIAGPKMRSVVGTGDSLYSNNLTFIRNTCSLNLPVQFIVAGSTGHDISAYYDYTLPSGEKLGLNTFKFHAAAFAQTATPRFSGEFSKTAIRGQLFSYQAQASNGPIAAWSATGLPTGLSINSSGLISGTVDSGAATGAYYVNLAATNAVDTGYATLVINVETANPALGFGNQNYSLGQVGKNYRYQLLLSKPMPAGGPAVSYSATGLPAGLSLDTATGLVTGSPTATGVFSVQYTAIASGMTNGTQTHTINIASAVSIVSANPVFPADTTKVPLYTKVELLVTFDNLTVQSGQHFNPNPATGGVDLSAVFTQPGETWPVNGYYDGSSWRIRFSPTKLGQWTYTVTVKDSSGTSIPATGAFTCVASPYPGFVSINSQYLRFSNGAPFFGVGPNNGWLYENGGVEQPALSAFPADGLNLLSFWMATPWARPSYGNSGDYWWQDRSALENIESGLGNYYQPACTYLDGLINRAESANVYLLPTIWAHDQLHDGAISGWPAAWSHNAYNTICTPTDFYTTKNGANDTTQWDYQQNHYRYIIARWGYSRAIIGWVLVDEVDGTNGRNSAELPTWAAAVRTIFKNGDKYRANAAGTYPMGISKVDVPSYSPQDICITDSYTSQSSNIGVANTTATQTRTMRDPKPAFHGEFGGAVNPATDPPASNPSQPTHFTNGAWGGISAGACITPLLWCDEGWFPRLTHPTYGSSLRTRMKNIATFMSGIDFFGNTSLVEISSASSTEIILSDTNNRCWGTRLSDRGFGWIQRTSTGDVSGTVTFRSMNAGDYRVWWFNTATGALTLDTTTYTVDPTGGNANRLIATIPTTANDIAVKFQIIATGTAPTVAIWDGGGDGTKWTSAHNWNANLVPASGNTTDLTFPSLGSVTYISGNDAGNPFVLNKMKLTGTLGNTINGSALTFSGTSPTLTHDGSGFVTISNPVALSATTTVTGNGTGTVQLGGTLSSTGGISKQGSCTLSLNGSSPSYTGAITVSGGTLGGNGTVGSALTINSGGTVNPGNSVGTLTAASANFSGGALRIEIPSLSSADKLVLSGNATLGGTSSIIIDLTGWTDGANATFTVLQANTRTGFFTSEIKVNDSGNPETVYVRYDGGNVNVGINQIPTPATIGSFSAKLSGTGILLEWDCASEFENLGFNVLRREVGTENWRKVNAQMIPGRITTPEGKRYSLFDWSAADVGEQVEYRLESISIRGEREFFPQLAGPVTIATDAPEISLESLDAAIDSALTDVRHKRVTATAKTATRIVGKSQQLNAPAISKSQELRAKSYSSNSQLPAANSRSVSARSITASIEAVKVVYSGSGVLFVPAASLPAGYDINFLSITREGQSVRALAVLPDGLLLYAPGYADDYTDKDAFFLSNSTSPTAAGTNGSAQNLFDGSEAANTSPAKASVEYHDVYYDYGMLPIVFPPWFSDKYLTQGSVQSFSLSTPNLASGTATLTIDLWSMTQSSTVDPDHVLQAFVNGSAVGSVSWDGGNKAMSLSFTVPDGVLLSSANTIELLTPDLGFEQLSMVHGISIDYVKALTASAPTTIVSNVAQRFELSGLASANIWIVNTSTGSLTPSEAQAHADGSFNVRFDAAANTTYLAVPQGSEIAPLMVAERTIKPLSAGITYLAVGPKQFAADIQPLLVARSKQGLVTAFVDQEELFDYYGFGRYGPDPIRKAVRAVKPQYLLLVGRTTYDYRDYAPPTVDPLCPGFLISTTYHSQTISDPVYGDLGKGYPEICVGRFPVNTPEELAVAIAHTLAYKGLPISGQRALMVADEFDPKAGDFALLGDGVIASSPDIAWQKAYLKVTHATSPDVSESMRQAASGGADMIVFTGHGTSAGLGLNFPKMLDANLVQSWTGNVVLLQATCNGNWVGRDTPGYRSIATQALTQPQGGIAASISTTTYLTAGPAAEFMQQFIRQYSTDGQTWGQALLKTQQWAYQKSKTGKGVYADMTHTESILGDPALPIFNRADEFVSQPDSNSESVTPNAPNSNAPQTESPTKPTQPLVVKQLSGKLNFARTNSDHIKLSGVLLNAPDNISGSTATLNIGGVIFTADLDPSGRAQTEEGTLSIRRLRRARSIRAELKGAFVQALANDMAQQQIVVALQLSGATYSANVPVRYNSNGRRGLFRK